MLLDSHLLLKTQLSFDPATSCASSHQTMGTVEEGTLCAYCGVREAGYIPDGCVGPMCMGKPGCCQEVGEEFGWSCIDNKRLCRLGRSWIACLARDANVVTQSVFRGAGDEVQLRIYAFLWRV